MSTEGYKLAPVLKVVNAIQPFNQHLPDVTVHRLCGALRVRNLKFTVHARMPNRKITHTHYYNTYMTAVWSTFPHPVGTWSCS